MKNRSRTVLLIVLVLVAGCMATRFTNVWKDESYDKGPVKSVVVVAILQTPQSSKMVEDEMARQLQSRGVNTVLSYVEFTGTAHSEDTILSQLVRLGVDAALVTKLTGIRSKSRDDYTSASGVAIREEPQNYGLMQTSLYDAQSRKIVWSASTETWIVGMDTRLTSSFVSTVLKKLVDDKLIK